jgi:uncharacterized protein (TIGR02246 family)
MSDSRAEDEAAIQAVLVDSYKAWEAGDADAMVADYTADATAIMTGSLRESREVIRENMALAFEGPLKDSSTYNKRLSLRFVGRDAAIVRQRIWHPVRRRDRGPGHEEGERDLGFREAGRPVADRRLSQQPGAGARAVNPSW